MERANDTGGRKMRKKIWLSAGGMIGTVAVLVGWTGFYLSDKIYPRFDHGVVASADFDRKIPADRLRIDFSFLTKTVEHVHPDVTAITDAGAYSAKKAATLALINHPMTRTEFYRILAPFAGSSYNDGHTELILPQEEWHAYKAKGGMAPPFAVEVRPTELQVTKDMGGVPIPLGSRIISINGVPAEDLCRWLIGTQSMETLPGRESFAAARFANLIWAYGLKSPYRIALHAPGTTQTTEVTSAGVPVERWNVERSIGRDRAIDLTINDHIAHLVIKNFEQPWNRYQGSMRAAFQRIHDAHVSAVVLDLRENSGGDTRQSNELQSYLSDDQLPAVAEVDVKATQEAKSLYRSLLPEGFRWIPLNEIDPTLRGIEETPDDQFYRFYPEGTSPSRRSSPKKLAFHGDLYLLVGPYTYSTAMIAAAPYKYWKRATVIGRPTEEGLTFYGDFYEFDLPNSRLQMHVSHKVFRLVGSSGRHSQIVPDIQTSPEHPDAYQLSLEMIARKRAL
jgi:hypothetical protein